MKPNEKRKDKPEKKKKKIRNPSALQMWEREERERFWKEKEESEEGLKEWWEKKKKSDGQQTTLGDAPRSLLAVFYHGTVSWCWSIVSFFYVYFLILILVCVWVSLSSDCTRVPCLLHTTFTDIHTIKTSFNSFHPQNNHNCLLFHIFFQTNATFSPFFRETPIAFSAVA